MLYQTKCDLSSFDPPVGNDKHDFKNTVKDLLIVVVIGSCCRLFSLKINWLGCLMLLKEGFRMPIADHIESQRGWRVVICGVPKRVLRGVGESYLGLSCLEKVRIVELKAKSIYLPFASRLETYYPNKCVCNKLVVLC